MYLGSHAHATDVSEAELDRVTDSHIEILGSFVGRYAATWYLDLTTFMIMIDFVLFFLS